MLRSIVLLAGVAACGGGKGGGLGNDELVVGLSPAEVRDLCESLVAILGPARTVDCNGTPKMTSTQTIDQCVMSTEQIQTDRPDCTLTIGENRACFEAIADLTDEEVCGNVIPNECAAYLACSVTRVRPEVAGSPRRDRR